MSRSLSCVCISPIFATGVPNVLVVNPAFSANSVKDLLALAKNERKPLTYGSPGVGSVQHYEFREFLSAEIKRYEGIARAAKIKLN